VVAQGQSPGIPRKAAFTTVLSECDAEFALRVDPACLTRPAFHGGALPPQAKRSPAQPYMLIIAGGQGQSAIKIKAVINQGLAPPARLSPVPERAGDTPRR
jgi:hypothetical protein